MQARKDMDIARRFSQIADQKREKERSKLRSDDDYRDEYSNMDNTGNQGFVKDIQDRIRDLT